jgi:hypothetical protein
MTNEEQIAFATEWLAKSTGEAFPFEVSVAIEAMNLKWGEFRKDSDEFKELVAAGVPAAWITKAANELIYAIDEDNDGFTVSFSEPRFTHLFEEMVSEYFTGLVYDPRDDTAYVGFQNIVWAWQYDQTFDVIAIRRGKKEGEGKVFVGLEPTEDELDDDEQNRKTVRRGNEVVFHHPGPENAKWYHVSVTDLSPNPFDNYAETGLLSPFFGETTYIGKRMVKAEPED